MSQNQKVSCFSTRTLPPDVFYLNQQQHHQQPRMGLDYSFMSRFKFEDSPLTPDVLIDEIEEEEEEDEVANEVSESILVDEIMEEEEEQLENDVSESILDDDLDEEIIEEERFENDVLFESILEEEIVEPEEYFENDIFESILDEAIMEQEEFENDVSESVLDDGLDEEIIEEEGFENDILFESILEEEIMEPEEYFENDIFESILDEEIMEEEEEEQLENDVSESILDDGLDEEIIEEEGFENDILFESILEEEIMELEEYFENDIFESILDEEIMEQEEFENDVSVSILDDGLDKEITEEGFEIDVSENMETKRMEFDIHLINEGYHQPHILPHQTNQVRARTPRMRVNNNYIHYRIQVPQSIDEEIEEEEDNVSEVLDQDMSEYYLETRTFCAMDTDNFNEVEEQEACAICLFDYQDEDTIATLQCGHEFHAKCINKLLLRKKSCPFCRASVFSAHNT